MNVERTSKRITPSIVLASIALLVSLGGTSLAAASFISGSQIRPHSIPKNRLTASAVRSLRGQRGREGPAGPQGDMGLPGVFSAADVVEVASPVVTIPPGTVRSATAHCPDATGDIALSGGWGGGSSPPTPDNGVSFDAPVPGDAHAWRVDMENFSSADTTLQAFVICGVPGH